MSNTILFYDGDCGFCNRTVQFILKHERNSEIAFSALQSEFAANFFKNNGLSEPDFSTFYFYSNNKIYIQAKAAFQVIPFLKWYMQPLRIFSLLPNPITAAVYRFVAKRRKRIGGTYCVIPSSSAQKRFIQH